MDERRVVEINGVKLDIDLRHAVRIDTLRIGDSVSVLKKTYSDYKVFPGVIVGFEPFRELPTVIVAYVNLYNCDLEIIHYNSESKEVDIVAAIDTCQISIEKESVIKKFDREIEKKVAEIDDIERKKQYFSAMFGKYFEKGGE